MTRNDIGIHVNFLDLSLAIVVDGVAWSPDVADDMTLPCHLTSDAECQRCYRVASGGRCYRRRRQSALEDPLYFCPEEE